MGGPGVLRDRCSNGIKRRLGPKQQQGENIVVRLCGKAYR